MTEKFVVKTVRFVVRTISQIIMPLTMFFATVRAITTTKMSNWTQIKDA